MTSDTISIEKIKEIIIPILKKYPVRKAILFGLYAKGNYNEFKSNSIMVEASIFNLSQIVS